MSNLSRYALRYSIVVLLISLLLYLTRNQWDEFNRVQQLSPATVLALSFLFIAYQFLAAVTLKAFAGVFGVTLRNREALALVSIRSFGNYLPLNAGWTANAVYFKFRKNVPVASFAVLMAGNLLLGLLTVGLMGIGLLGVHYIQTSDLQPLLFAVYSSVVITSVAVLIIPVPKITWTGRVGDFIQTMHQGWILIRSRYRLLVFVVTIQIFSQITAALQYLVVCRELHIELALTPILILSLSTTIIQFATIVPGNLGIREAIAGAVATAFGVTFNAGLLAAAVTRVINMIWIFLLGTFFALTLPLVSEKTE